MSSCQQSLMRTAYLLTVEPHLWAFPRKGPRT
jgi:hypothetical protein